MQPLLDTVGSVEDSMASSVNAMADATPKATDAIASAPQVGSAVNDDESVVAVFQAMTYLHLPAAPGFGGKPMKARRIAVPLTYRVYRSGNEGFYAQIPKFFWDGRTYSGAVMTFLSPRDQPEEDAV